MTDDRDHRSLFIWIGCDNLVLCAGIGLEPDGNPEDDRVADLAVRRKLDQLTPNARSEAEATAF